MMKQLKHILIASLALAFLTLSCIDPLEPMPKGLDARLPDKALVFSPSILGSTVVTKAINTGVDELGELAIETLDVYVYKVNDLTKPFKRYHFITKMPEDVSTLPDGVTLLAAAALASGTDIVLETDWRQAGYDQTGTQKYRIYSIANSRMAHSDRWVDMSEETLKKKTITSAETHYGSYDIVRPKDGVGPGDDYYNIHIEDKNFLMDGMIDEWTITVNESQQYFTLNEEKSFPLTRAAAKFIVNVSFDPDFLAELAEEGTVIERHDEGSGVFSTTGAPRFKFANFMPVTYEVTPANTPSGDWRDGNLWSSRYNYDFPDHTYPNPNYDPENPDAEPQTLSGDLSNAPTEPNYTGKATYTLTTYSYSFAWNSPSDGAVNAPALVLRVNYKTGDNPAETFFYRVPLVDLTKISSIDRNYLYVVDATISSKGAIIEDIEPMNVNLRYKVIPWPNNIPAEDITEVQGSNLLYFTADTTFTLRGENRQYTKLEYFTPKSVKGTDGHYEYEPKISNVRVYYVPAAGDTTRVIAPAAGTSPAVGTWTYGEGNHSWSGSRTGVTGSYVSISLTPNVDGGGTVDIASDVLANRAVKHIEFDASVTFTVTNPETNETITQTVTHHYFIKHFPLDNIQSILGSWSSRWDGVSGGTITKYYRNKYSKQSSYYDWVQVDQETWAGYIGNANEDRMNAQSPETARNNCYATGQQNSTTVDSDNYGTLNPANNPPGNNNNPVTSTWSGISSVTITSTGRSWMIPMPYYNVRYDYVSDYEYRYYTSWGSRVYYGRASLKKYRYYYHYELVEGTIYSYNPEEDGWEAGTYQLVGEEPCNQQEYEAAMVGRTETVTSTPSTGDWVVYNGGGNDYEYRDNYSNYYGVYGYYAKVSYNNSIYRLTASGTRGESAQVAGNNVHMYVIQISKSESSVVLGRPNIDASYQSQDNVVSPAFMIASQLGAVDARSFDASSAAIHCGTYMEVGSNNRRFAGWRLPTKAEIAYIAGYQNNNQIQGQGVFTYVLTGNWYYTLDGGDARSNYPPGAPNYDASDNRRYVRCIRDLTPSEVEELNRTGVITDATY